MTYDMINLRKSVEYTRNADLVHEIIGFTAERLIELEIGAVTARSMARKPQAGRHSAMDTATGIGRRGR